MARRMCAHESGGSVYGLFVSRSADWQLLVDGAGMREFVAVRHCFLCGMLGVLQRGMAS
jgi:hypothetical protein